MTRFIDFLERNTLRPEVIDAAHEWLVEHLESPAHLLPLRATGSFELAGTRLPVRAHRGRRIRLAGSGRQVVFCDNELPVWLYGQMPGAGFFSRGLQELLDHRLAPVADSRAATEGDGTLHFATVARPWGSAKRHKHIFDAGLPRGSNNSALTNAEVVSKFLRFLHPVNWFLFPANLARDAEQNDAPEYQYVAAVFMSRRCPKSFREFLDLVNPNSIGWRPKWREIGEGLADTLLMPEAVQTLRPPLSSVTASGIQAGALASVADAAAPTEIEAFDIVENRENRFHLERFGVGVGGTKRDKLFYLRVIDRAGRVLLESHPTTAARLGIAERGRGDYDRNRFRQTDLLLRPSPGVPPRPFSAIGRRIPWR